MSPLLHLDPSLPVVWRSTEGLQIGVDPPIALIDSIDQRYLPVLAALHRGISEEGYDAIASGRASLLRRPISSLTSSRGRSPREPPTHFPG